MKIQNIRQGRYTERDARLDLNTQEVYISTPARHRSRQPNGCHLELARRTRRDEAATIVCPTNLVSNLGLDEVQYYKTQLDGVKFFPSPLSRNTRDEVRRDGA